jgi:hypothetical protein
MQRITPEITKINTVSEWLLGAPKINKEFRGSKTIPKKFKKLTC